MSEPGSSGKAGPTPIPKTQTASWVGEQVRPAFHFGPHEVRLGDRVSGIHRGSRTHVKGTVMHMYDVICLRTEQGTFPLERIAIHEVQPPLPFE